MGFNLRPNSIHSINNGFGILVQVGGEVGGWLPLPAFVCPYLLEALIQFETGPFIKMKYNGDYPKIHILRSE